MIEIWYFSVCVHSYSKNKNKSVNLGKFLKYLIIKKLKINFIINILFLKNFANKRHIIIHFP